MPQLGYSKRKWHEDEFNVLIDAIRKAFENMDFDSGWIVATTTVRHKLGRLPRMSQAFEANDQKGTGFKTLPVDSVTATEITITPTLAFVRVQADL